MLTQIKQKLSVIYNKRQQLSDIRVLGQLIFVFIVLLISWSGVKAIQSNYALQKQIAALNQENQVQQLQNNTLQLQNDYYNTNQYLELSARENLGLGLPGETELLVPKNIALAQLSQLPNQVTTTKPTQPKPMYEKNFEAWINFILHRQGSN